MAPNRVDQLYERFSRRLQLLRGAVLKLRGARAGERFGIGRHVQVWHPRCLSVGHDVTIFDGAYIRSVRPDTVRIGGNTDIHMGFWLDCGGAHDAPGSLSIGRGCLLQPYITINAGGARIAIGDHVLLGQMVSIHAGNHAFEDPNRLIVEQGTTHQGITIEEDCWIGAKATILDGVTIGRGSVVGAGAVVTGSLPALSISVGNPARIIRMRGGEN
jgi:carbonic anhydrase/acetyltransferase-like protein (isoleucine patch superfamily)